MSKRFAAVLIAAITTIALSACAESPGSDDDTIDVAFVYVSPVNGSGWTQAWDEARLELESELGANTSTVEPIPETADAVGVLENLVAQGNEVIFATAFGYQPFVAQVAEANPDVVFVAIGPWAQEEEPPANVSVVANDSWNVRYALGVLAAETTETGTLGFVAANPIPTVTASVNAFQLGAQSVDPDIETRVVFTGTWYDPARASQAAQTLAGAGADVIAQYEDSTGTILGAENADVFGIGSEVDSSESSPETYLSGSVNDWRAFAVDIVSSVQDDAYEQVQTVGTIESGMATIGAFHADVPDDLRALVEEAMSGLADGSVVPFTGPISSNTGEQILADGESWPDSGTVLEHQDFLVEGIVGSLPN